MTHTPASLTAFTERVKAAFLAKQIRAPVHLCSKGQAEPLIEIFKGIRPQDHVFSTWRSTWHALLKGWPEDEVFAEILAGRSMYLMSAKYRFLSSSIVGGILPIACGVAAGIKRRRDERLKAFESGAYMDDQKVYCFIGDMCAKTGLFHEFRQYCEGHALPVRVIVEDNGLSTDSPTEETWGRATQPLPITRYEYKRTTPHVGVGERVEF